MTIEDVVKSIVAFLIMFVPGVLFIVQGIRMLQGEGKAWYFARHIYAGAVYGYIPLGIGGICMALATIPESKALSNRPKITWVARSGDRPQQIAKLKTNGY